MTMSCLGLARVSTPRDRLGRAPSEAPALQLIGGEGADGAAEHDDLYRDAGSAASGSSGRTTVEAARDLLASTDAQSYYRMLTSLVRPSHSSVLQELPYTPASPFHDPACVVVELEPTNVETLEVYARARRTPLDRVLAPAFVDPAIDQSCLTALSRPARHRGVQRRGGDEPRSDHRHRVGDGGDESTPVRAGSHVRRAGTHDHGGGDRGSVNVLVSRMVVNPAGLQRSGAAGPAVGDPDLPDGAPDPESTSLEARPGARGRANNKVMRHEFDVRLSDGGQLLAMAASGSQDLSLPRVDAEGACGVAPATRRGPVRERPPCTCSPCTTGRCTLMLVLQVRAAHRHHARSGHARLRGGGLTQVREQGRLSSRHGLDRRGLPGGDRGTDDLPPSGGRPVDPGAGLHAPLRSLNRRPRPTSERVLGAGGPPVP